MRLIFKTVLIALAFAGIAAKVKSQEVSAILQLDTNQIVAGQQIIAKLRLTEPAGFNTPWIAIPDTFAGIEVLAKGAVDTLHTGDNNKITREQKFTITAFDSGYFVITPMVFTYKQPGDTTTFSAETQAQLLTVNLMPVDTTKAIRDIKGPIEVGLTWQEIATYAAGAILILALIVLIYYLIKRRKIKPVETIRELPKKPAHEIALERLEALQQEKLWQQGNYKLYFTLLSEIVREYISNRWGVDAMERTTDEILHSSMAQQLNNDLYQRLRTLLQLSDLAKFAKHTPLASENEQALADTFTFVNETKVLTTELPLKNTDSAT
jgi:hypothetical protein